MSWTSVRDALVAAIRTASGLSSGYVIWKNQDVNAPKLDYVALSIGPVSNPGQDWIDTAYIGGADPLADMRQTVRGLRAFTLGLEIFTAATCSTNDALDRAETIRSSLRLEAVRATLRSAGVSILDIGDTQYAPSVVALGFRGRALLDLRCLGPAVAVTALTGYFAEVNGTMTTQGGGVSPHTKTFSAP